MTHDRLISGIMPLVLQMDDCWLFECGALVNQLSWISMDFLSLARDIILLGERNEVNPMVHLQAYASRYFWKQAHFVISQVLKVVRYQKWIFCSPLFVKLIRLYCCSSILENPPEQPQWDLKLRFQIRDINAQAISQLGVAFASIFWLVSLCLFAYLVNCEQNSQICDCLERVYGLR